MVILKTNDVRVGIGELFWGLQTIVKYLRSDYGLDQLVINYPHIGDCIGDSVGLPIPWAIENLMMCSNEVLETSIESSSEKIEFECNDKEMIEVLDSKVDMSRSLDAIGLHFGYVIPKES